VFVVNTTADTHDAHLGDGLCADANGQCSLRAAVEEADNRPNATTTIVLDPSRGTYALTLPAELDLSSTATSFMTICSGTTACVAGGSRATVDATATNTRAFAIETNTYVTMQDLKITGGHGDSTINGAGIDIMGVATLDRVIVTGNTTSGSGGGIFVPTTATDASLIESSVITGNTAAKGGGIRSDHNISVSWSTISKNTSTTSSYGMGVMAAYGAQVSLDHTLLQNPGGPDCDAAGSPLGTFVSSGYNLSQSAASVCGLGDTTSSDVSGTTAALGGDGYTLTSSPTAPNAAIDEGGTCSTQPDFTRDVDGNLRANKGLACDIGGYEKSPTNADEVVAKWLTSTYTAPDDNTATARAYARYAVGNIAGGDADIATLAADPPPSGNWIPDYQFPSVGSSTDWNRFTFPNDGFDLVLMMRLFDERRPATWTGSNTAYTTVKGWATSVANICNYGGSPSKLYNALWQYGAFTSGQSENVMLTNSVDCMLALYGTNQTTAGQRWEAALASWVRADAQKGLLGEIAAPSYGRYSLAAVMAMADFTTMPDLASVAHNWLDVFWQDAAMNYNANTGVVGASGSRTYQPTPGLDSDNQGNNGASHYYQTPTLGWSHSWTWFYGWNTTQDLGQSQLLTAATSLYTQWSGSVQVAQQSGKSEYYVSMRPGELLGTPSVVRELTVNSSYMVGAQTYADLPTCTDPLVTQSCLNMAMVQGIWYSVSANNGSETTDRIMISGVGEQESSGNTSNYTDWQSINGAAYGNVIIAARNNRAANSLGVRVYFGQDSGSGFRSNLQQVGNWWFTKAGNTMVAIQFAGSVTQLPVTKELDEEATSDPSNLWYPLVVQTAEMGSGPGQISDFATFKTMVAQNTQFQYNSGTGTLTYWSLAGDEYVMSRQDGAASLPQVYVGGTGSNIITTSPSTAYDAPPSTPSSPNYYLSVPSASNVKLCPPVGSSLQCETVSFS
jgi:CSLREA domain-containing protein